MTRFISEPGELIRLRLTQTRRLLTDIALVIGADGKNGGKMWNDFFLVKHFFRLSARIRAGSEICLHFSSLQRSDLLVEKIEFQNPNRPAKKFEFWQNLFPGGTGTNAMLLLPHGIWESKLKKFVAVRFLQ